GEACSYSEECQSGNCNSGNGASTTKKYCCGAGNEFCCADDNDCASGYECKNYACVARPSIPTQGNGTGNAGDQKPQGCLPIAILLIIAAGLYAYNKGHSSR
ncbi:MAG: hypothetical protein N3G76_01465, partial [Candidatus Micrarchaeota archaeon]|nr:hypothetical protein [Candidatus Micrarchaeota archaeon]